MHPIRISCTKWETETDALADAAARSLAEHGCAILDDLYPKETLNALRSEFCATYAGEVAGKAGNFVDVGQQRRLIPIELAAGFANPMLFAHPLMVAVCAQSLGDEFIIDNFGAVASQPGATAQHKHRDSGPKRLFDSSLDDLAPAHALTFALPLVAMNDSTGTTALWPGSHRRPRSDEDAAVEPEIPLGSCALWDYRLYHAGTANRSSNTRPLIFVTYARPWFSDRMNYKKPGVRRIVANQDFFESLEPNVRSLFR